MVWICKHPDGMRTIMIGGSVLACMALGTGNAAAADSSELQRSPAELTRMSIEELANIEITSVSKRPERLSDAAASIYVITREDIRRSGANSIPEMLRLAPNLQVARVDASQYAIAARGFNSTTANKLLVMIDGRSVYTPLFSGVFWDVQDVLPEDIERIEVVSGPGGTLWGANAVNGVINIITRDSSDTPGTLVSAGAGTHERHAGVRYGGKLGEDGSYRITAKGTAHKDTNLVSGADAEDSRHKADLGFRFDWERSGDALTVVGNAYDGTTDQRINADRKLSGFHLLSRWNRKLGDDSSIQVQAYFDKTRRNYPGTFGETLDTYDIEVQHRFEWGKNHDVLWGGGYRFSRDDVTNSAVLAFLPARSDLTLANVFVQDSIALDDKLQLTLGAKLEHNNYTGLEFQPNARLAWKLRDNALLWSAISRSVRTPSRTDRELFAPGSPPFTILAGGPDFQSEKVLTYEIGYRMQPTSYASFSASIFYNIHDELRSSEPTTAAAAPVVLANMMEGDTYGVEMWGNYRVNDWWRLSAGYNYLQKDLRFKPGSRAASLASAGNDPLHQFSLRSTMNLAHDLELDVALRKIGTLPNPNIPSYVGLDMRLGWQVTNGVEVSLTGTNLLDRRHPEFGSVLTRSELERAFFLKILWNF